MSAARRARSIHTEGVGYWFVVEVPIGKDNGEVATGAIGFRRVWR